MNYDAQRGQVKAIGTLVKLKPYKQSFLTLAHFSTQNLPLNPIPPPLNFEQRSNQMRALIGYGDQLVIKAAYPSATTVSLNTTR